MFLCRNFVFFKIITFRGINTLRSLRLSLLYREKAGIFLFASWLGGPRHPLKAPLARHKKNGKVASEL